MTTAQILVVDDEQVKLLRVLQKYAINPEAFRHATGPAHPLPLGESGR